MLDRIQEWMLTATDEELIDVFAEIYVEFIDRKLPLAPFMVDPFEPDPEPVRKKWWRGR